ncbi:unnamed protein product [Prorocentrum cordatum]|uniref:Uncharacterized protein n=1 Tax=Prorocentrum cordatum TaxID=2364126 RepID=A0ABN9SYE6_9DINO|nr:unnamed protein product [Polarella glacialis]
MLESRAREAAAWAAEAHIQTDGQDHEDLMDCWLAKRHAPPPQAPRADGPANPDHEPPEDPGGFGVQELDLGLGAGWETCSGLSTRWQPHRLLLQSDVEGTNPRVKHGLFCCRRDAVSPDGELTLAVSAVCLGRDRGGTRDQLGRMCYG